jgi:hypothetical protein
VAVPACVRCQGDFSDGTRRPEELLTRALARLMTRTSQNNETTSWTVFLICVSQNHRKGGEGSSLIKLIQEKCKAAGCEGVDLHPDKNNPDDPEGGKQRVKFYEKNGFAFDKSKDGVMFWKNAFRQKVARRRRRARAHHYGVRQPWRAMARSPREHARPCVIVVSRVDVTSQMARRIARIIREAAELEESLA